MIAVSARAGGQVADLASIAKDIGAVGEIECRAGDRWSLAAWGLANEQVAGGEVFPLSRGARGASGDLTPADIGSVLIDRPYDVVDLMPPFAAGVLTPRGITIGVDAIGARHVFAAEGSGWTAVSTCATALARLRGSSIDREAVAVQSVLGWQLGDRTWFADVRKLGAGSVTLLADGQLDDIARGHVDSSDVDALRPLALADGVASAAELLRAYLDRYLEDHPDATLQLTGGQDSRLLLSAIPVARRRGLDVMTLAAGDGADVEIASQLAARYGMHHHVITLDGLDRWTASEAHGNVVAAARRLGCMADPLALAALRFAESKIEQGPRISGLGGEVARGFYYVFPTLAIPVTPRSASALANWRMFANEAASTEALDPAFRDWARMFAHHEVHRILDVEGGDMRTASDAFYLEQRMQRWAGITDSAVCFDRDVVNPMLDRRFLAIAEALSPADKRNSRFLGQLQVALDGELADVALDGRPTPRAYAERSLSSTAAQAASFGRRAFAKARQKVRADHKPPAGGAVIAAKVVEHWQDRPSVLDCLAGAEIVRPEWLEQVVGGQLRPDPATVAFVMNLLVALADTAADS